MASQEVVDAARRVLLEVAAGRAVPWPEVEQLLDAVLGAELVRGVEAGGEHAVMRAVQLAGAIAALGVEDDAEDERGAS